MSDFIAIDNNSNLSPVKYPAKVSITANDIDLTYIISKDNGKEYKIKYIVMINPKGKVDPSQKLTPKNVNMTSLRNALITWLKPKDRKYFSISNFDTRHVEFIFDHKKWLRDATSGMQPKIEFSKFDRVFKFRIQPPYLIRTDEARFQFEEFIIKRFKEWLEKSRKEAKYFKYLMPDKFRRKIRTKLRNMFEWSYDFQWNRITAKLKNIYILALLFATGAAVKRLTSQNIQDSKKNLFATQVRKKLDSFDKKKWEKYIKRKGFV